MDRLSLGVVLLVIAVVVASSSCATDVTPIADPPIESNEMPVVSVECLEVSQAIQNLDTAVPLVCGKDSFVRAYLSYSGEGAIEVSGSLQISDADGKLLGGAIPANASVLLEGTGNSLDSQRHSLKDSLNFTVPPALTKGVRRFQLVSLANKATGVPVVPAQKSSCPQTYQFYNAPPLRLRVLGLSFVHNGTESKPRDLDYQRLESWLKRAYPVSDVLMEATTIASENPWPFDCKAVNEQLIDIRNVEMSNPGFDGRTHYYGMVSAITGTFMRGCTFGIPSTPQPATVASGPASVTRWGYWDGDGSTGDWHGAHELGHTLGLTHFGACGDLPEDTTDPFPKARLSLPPETYVGMDVGGASITPAVLPGEDWRDVMTYCDNLWISARNYERLLRRLLAEDALGTPYIEDGCSPYPVLLQQTVAAGRAGNTSISRPDFTPVEGDFLSIVAEINLDKRTARIKRIRTLDRAVESTPDPGSSLKIRLLDSHGTLTSEFNAQILESSDPKPAYDNVALTTAVIRKPDGTVSVELLLDNALKDRRNASANAPEISNIRMRQVPASGELVLEWDAEDNDDPSAETLRYVVLLSVDGGDSYRVIANGLNRRRLVLDQKLLTSAEVSFRVLADDGFNSVQEDSGLLLPPP